MIWFVVFIVGAMNGALLVHEIESAIIHRERMQRLRQI